MASCDFCFFFFYLHSGKVLFFLLFVLENRIDADRNHGKEEGHDMQLCRVGLGLLRTNAVIPNLFHETYSNGAKDPFIIAACYVPNVCI